MYQILGILILRSHGFSFEILAQSLVSVNQKI